MSLRVLHTSDWHLGKQLLKVDFEADMTLFFNWLIATIQEDKIDLLLMSGDLFDQSNPSQAALTQYYQFLKALIPLQCKVIITGGNHDAASVLNAPKELLGILDVHVVGGSPENLTDAFITMERNGQKIAVAAIPFLRDKDIRQIVAGESYDDKISQIKNGMAAYFENVNTHFTENHSGIPLLIMGHLYAQNVETSDSEREIQIGNQAGIDRVIFGTNAAYVALGHIHKPQMVGSKTVRYSGSPIPLSFSEREDIKQVVILNFENDELDVTIKEIPHFRKLITLKGTINEVTSKLQSFESTSPLIDLIELQIEEENESVVLITALENLMATESESNYQIVKGKITFQNKVQNTASLLISGEEISDFEPIELFEKRLLQDEILENKTALLAAFKEIMESMQETSNK